MRRTRRSSAWSSGLIAFVWVAACGRADDSANGGDDYDWQLPAGFPRPRVPVDNPMSTAKVELGRRLFYDKRLSGNGTSSCGTCHDPRKAFTDGLAQAVGSTGEIHPRGTMTLTNIGYANALTWANDLLPTLEKQALVPMFGEAPVELGLSGQEEALLARLRAEPLYQSAFAAAFPAPGELITLERIVKAISSFERIIISGNSPYDRFVQGHDPSALDASAERGRALFFSERCECFHCHGGFNFADNVSHAQTVITETAFHNTALYDIDGLGAYPRPSRGLLDVSGIPADMGRFKAPTLRNIALTAPYMHDGSIPTLEGVIDHYARGGRKIEHGPNAGDGAKSPLKSEFLRGFLVSDSEKADLVHFLESLTDPDFANDPRFADPWSRP